MLSSISKFHGFATPLCNLRFSRFKVGGVEYNSAEQYIIAKKAEFFKDQDALAAVMEQNRTPISMRHIPIRNFNVDEWRKALPMILFTGLMEKVAFAVFALAFLFSHALFCFSSPKTMVLENISSRQLGIVWSTVIKTISYLVSALIDLTRDLMTLRSGWEKIGLETS